MRQREPCWQKWTSSNAQRSIDESCAQCWSFFYARPAVGDRLCRLWAVAGDNVCPVGERAAGIVALPIGFDIAHAKTAPTSCHPKDSLGGRPASALGEPLHAPLPTARLIICLGDRCDRLRPVQPSLGGRNAAPN